MRAQAPRWSCSDSALARLDCRFLFSRDMKSRSSFSFAGVSRAFQIFIFSSYCFRSSVWSPLFASVVCACEMSCFTFSSSARSSRHEFFSTFCCWLRSLHLAFTSSVSSSVFFACRSSLRCSADTSSWLLSHRFCSSRCHSSVRFSSSSSRRSFAFSSCSCLRRFSCRSRSVCSCPMTAFSSTTRASRCFASCCRTPFASRFSFFSFTRKLSSSATLLCRAFIASLSACTGAFSAWICCARIVFMSCSSSSSHCRSARSCARRIAVSVADMTLTSPFCTPCGSDRYSVLSSSVLKRRRPSSIARTNTARSSSRSSVVSAPVNFSASVTGGGRPPGAAAAAAAAAVPPAAPEDDDVVVRAPPACVGL
eukprot:Rhum_TRINITY_DN23367_c0_g1::Rhum_TRINITY_DN23367_c0_g1_i1::g.177807::m.177807